MYISNMTIECDLVNINQREGVPQPGEVVKVEVTG